jgi:hypothetical protein
MHEGANIFDVAKCLLSQLAITLRKNVMCVVEHQLEHPRIILPLEGVNIAGHPYNLQAFTSRVVFDPGPV